MNSESPLVPQGSFLEQKNKGRARVRIAVFVVLAIHCVGVMALLMQGCKKPSTENAQGIVVETNTPTPPAFIEPTNQYAALPETNLPSPLPTDPAPIVPIQEPILSTTPVPPSTVTEHKVVRGDSFGKLAKHYGVSVKAIEEANPGVEASRIKLGSTLRIPAAAPASTSMSPSGAPSASAGSAAATGLTYKVKSGDNLLKVAKAHGVTVKAIRAANNMKTDRIRVGQNLKIPSKAGSSNAEGATSTPSTTAP